MRENAKLFGIIIVSCPAARWEIIDIYKLPVCKIVLLTVIPDSWFCPIKNQAKFL